MLCVIIRLLTRIFLQYLYAIRDLRLGLEARQTDTAKPITETHIVVGGRAVAETELERSRRC